MIAANHSYWSPLGVPFRLLFEHMTIWDWVGLTWALALLVLLWVSTGSHE